MPISWGEPIARYRQEMDDAVRQQREQHRQVGEDGRMVRGYQRVIDECCQDPVPVPIMPDEYRRYTVQDEIQFIPPAIWEVAQPIPIRARRVTPICSNPCVPIDDDSHLKSKGVSSISILFSKEKNLNAR